MDKEHVSYSRSFASLTDMKILKTFRAMNRDVRTVAGWDFERIIPCHGVRINFLLFRKLRVLIRVRFLRTSSRRMASPLGERHTNGI